MSVGLLRGIKLSRICSHYTNIVRKTETDVFFLPTSSGFETEISLLFKALQMQSSKSFFQNHTVFTLLPTRQPRLEAMLPRRQIHNAAQNWENFSSYLYLRLLKRDGNWERILEQCSRTTFGLLKVKKLVDR